MAYVAPYIDVTGLHIPTYQDILDYFVAQAESIFGSDVYLDEDAKDYQLLSVIAGVANDCNLGLQDSYNQLAPSTATGAGLDKAVGYNGLTRKTASYSVCQVTLSGTASTAINNGVIQDAAGYKWDLPASVTIGEGGTEEVTATCETIGAITAPAGTITKIMTPTAGWTSVTNAGAAVPGEPTEEDSELRARQALSTELPSQTTLEGTLAALSTLPTTRQKVYENYTDLEDANGIPGHSICCVVEGGTDAEVAQVIYENRGLGCGMYGDTTIDITDDYGNVTTISFIRPTYVPIYVTLTIHGFTGYTNATKDAIKLAVADYLNNLQIGQTVSVLSGIAAAANSVNSLTTPVFSIHSVGAGTSEETQGTTDISVDFDHVAQGDVGNIEIVDA